MPPPKEPRLTPKQLAFVEWYCSAAVNGNGTEAARRAGYKGNDYTLANMAADNIRKPYIKAEIEARMSKALSGAEVTVEAVLRTLSIQEARALEAGQFSASIRATELKGRYLKMFTDRIEHVQSFEDMSTDELTRLLGEIMEAGKIDLGRLTAKDAASHGSNPDSAGTQTTH